MQCFNQIQTIAISCQVANGYVLLKSVFELVCRITTWLHQWKQSTLLWPACPRRLPERSQIFGNTLANTFEKYT